MATKQEMLSKLREAEHAGIDLSSPKAVVTHMLAQGDKEAVLWFYKKGSVEFDFDYYRKLVAELKAN
ncbi:hypothetical protein R0K05_02190 [Planococcus sp. SIMBA_160]